MDIESFSGAATVAAACTIVFILVMKSWQLISRRVSASTEFADDIVREAAQRFRDEFEKLNTSQSIYLSAALVFVVLFAAAHALQANRLYAGYPYWQLSIFLTALAIGVLIALVRLIRTFIRRHQVRLLRDANIAVGHNLQQIAADFGRVYHDVETSAGIIDHVIAGQNGVYAINVIARRPIQQGLVELENNELHFAPVDKTESIIANGKSIAALEREFRRLLDRRVRVRSVVAVPGWDVNKQSSDEHLLVNTRSLPMLRGWKDQADYLMDEDVAALHEKLSALTRG